MADHATNCACADCFANGAGHFAASVGPSVGTTRDWSYQARVVRGLADTLKGRVDWAAHDREVLYEVADFLAAQRPVSPSEPPDMAIIAEAKRLADDALVCGEVELDGKTVYSNSDDACAEYIDALVAISDLLSDEAAASRASAEDQK